MVSNLNSAQAVGVKKKMKAIESNNAAYFTAWLFKPNN